ncbi:MAG: hypothetical protein P8189_18445 [Anaerolineae bacterium]
MNTQPALSNLPSATTPGRVQPVMRLLLPVGWALTTVGYFGPWIAHQTAALTLSGVDMGEFVKFLPSVVDGSLQVMRQFFYLPPIAVTVSIALLGNRDELGYPRSLRALMLLLALPISLQLLPPAWAPSTLLTAEFRLQTVALALCWLLLAGSWALARLPSWLVGSLGTGLSLGALILPSWQLFVARPAISELFRVPPGIGWGFFLCLAGLAVTVAASTVIVPGSGARRLTLRIGE